MSSIGASAHSKGSTGKLVFFIVFGLLTGFVTIAKNARIFEPTSEIAQHFAPAKSFLIVHAFFGGLALVLGAFQLSNRLRARYLPLHRKLGYLYVLGVFISGPFAIPVAMRTSNLSLVAASSVQAFGWMVTTGIALYCIRRGNVEQHRRWMMRGYPFAMVFTVGRLIIPIPPIMKLGL
ncbi:MAG TPA: DUF2306 domain-containing protein, partial [Planctomycetota bacterium]|nr:DUF2306 domain-containing protein [Planctomycetota bacterium]